MAAPDITFDSAAAGCIRRREFLRQNREQLISKSINPAPWRERAYGKAFPQDERETSSGRSTNFTTAPRRPRSKPEQPARQRRQSLSRAGNRWNPMIDAISTYVNGCELDQVSISDMDAYEDTNVNWRVRRGYGALMGLTACLPACGQLRGDADRSFRQPRADRTSQGTLTANQVIVTVPTNLIADERSAFIRVAEKVDAARGLPLGLATR